MIAQFRVPTLILVLCFFYSSMTFQIQITDSVVESNNEWTRILLGVNGGTPPYKLIYTDIPVDWKQVNNRIYIPIFAFTVSRRYPCKVIVRDAENQEFMNTVVFGIRAGSRKIQSQRFPYDYQFTEEFFNREGFQGRPEMKKINIDVVNPLPKIAPPPPVIQTRSSRQSENLVVTTGSGLQNIVKTLLSDDQPSKADKQLERIKSMLQPEGEEPITSRTIESIFERFPSPNELDEILLERDSFLILKTIQTVIRSEQISCLQKISYISDFFGRILSAIEMKQFTLDQLSVIIKGATEEIQRLQSEISFAKEEISKLSVLQIKQELTKEITSLEEAYDDYNNNYEKLQREENDLELSRANLQLVEQQADESRRELTSDKLELAQIENDIQKLEKSLAQKRRRRDEVEQKIELIESQIRSFQFEKGIILRNIERTEYAIQQLKDISDRLKGVYSNIEISVQRLRNDIKRNYEKEEQLHRQINEMETRLITERSKAVTREQAMLQDFIIVLRSSVPNIQEELDKMYYQCFNVENVETETVNGNIVYIITRGDFSRYMTTTYQLATFETGSLIGKISLTTFHILGPAWRNQYGRIFQDIVMANSVQFSFEEDFNCLNPSTLQVGSGRILNITRNTIRIQTSVGQVILKLSTCSRLESTSIIPSIGQTIFWRGNEAAYNIYEVYFATCID